MNKLALAFFVSLTGIASSALAENTLLGFATADNGFAASISTSPTLAGTPWFSGDSWPTTFTNSIVLTEAGTYYLHVRAQDFGRPEMFIGRFTLSGPDATFANGTQVLVTNTADWVVSTTGFGVNTTAPTFLGDNGAGPWGSFPSMPDAAFIWAPQYDQGIAYFSAQFTIVPAPGALALGGIGLIAVGRRRR